MERIFSTAGRGGNYRSRNGFMQTVLKFGALIKLAAHTHQHILALQFVGLHVVVHIEPQNHGFLFGWQETDQSIVKLGMRAGRCPASAFWEDQHQPFADIPDRPIQPQ
jgi:hypothetical protein